MKQFDLIILGGGAAGFSSAMKANEFHVKTLHETWIIPKFHSSGLNVLNEQKIYGLAEILQVIFKKFQIAIKNSDFNFVIRTAPYPLSDVPFYHWHIQLLPRTKITGGFEYGTKIQVNTVLPEESAEILRECKC